MVAARMQPQLSTLIELESVVLTYRPAFVFKAVLQLILVRLLVNDIGFECFECPQPFKTKEEAIER